MVKTIKEIKILLLGGILIISFVVFNMQGSLIFANIANAQEKGTGISISPVTFELTANPGDALTSKLRIYNPSDVAIVVKMEVQDFKAVGEEGQAVVTTNEEMSYSIKYWTTIDPVEFTLEPQEYKFVDFTMDVPVNAEPGGKYGSILASIGGTAGSSPGGSAVAKKVGALVLLVVAGDVVEDLTVKDFSVPSFQEYGPVPFEIRFENKGSVHVKPKGFIVITDLLGRKVAEFEFPQRNVMPESVRKIEAEWNTKWLFGKYTASMVGVYGTSNENLTSRVITFWVLPWKLMLGVSVVLLIILTILFLSRKRLRMAAKILFKGEHHTAKKDS